MLALLHLHHISIGARATGSRWLQPGIMKKTYRSLALSRTSTTNGRRIAILGGFTGAMALVRLVAYPVPDRVFVLFALWLIAAAIYHLVLRRTESNAAVDGLQTIAFLADITFLTLMYSFLGGGWWMGATVHSIIAAAAFASLPKKRAQTVAIYAAVAFIAMIFSQAAGLAEPQMFLGIEPITGNYRFALAAAMFGTVALLSGAYIQDTFVKIMRRSQERNRVILQTVPDMILTTDRDGLVRTANDALSAQSGRGLREVIGHPFTRHIHAEDSAQVDSHFRATLDGESRQFEARYTASDGSPYWLLCSCNSLREDDNITGLLIVGRDISEQKRAEERLRASEGLLAETQRLTHLGSWEWDIAADDLRWSDELYRIFRVERNTRLSLGAFLDLVHPEDRERVRSEIESAFAAGEQFSFDHRIIRGDGQVRLLQALGHVVKNDAGVPIRMIGSGQDITEQTSLTEQLRQAQKMEAVGRLAGGVAHDFNNLLTVIDCHLQFLLEDIDPALPQHSDVEAIQKAADHATALTRQLLAFSRKQILQPKVIDLNDSVASMEKLLNRILGEHIRVETRLSPGIGLTRADPGQLEQVVMNLAVNARDAMPDGGELLIETRSVTLSELEARKHTGMGTGRHVLLSVSDTGVGIDDDAMSHIFEPFFTTKAVGSGIGLGLATVYGIVKQSGGYISVDSSSEKGTRFCIYFPVANETVADVPMPIGDPVDVRGSECILLVEDADALREVVQRILIDSGYSVHAAANGVEALEMFRANPGQVDLVLTDVVMPELGGREVAEAVVRARPELPVIFMSGYTETASIGRSTLPGGHAFIGKPFTPAALLRLVREVLGPAEAKQTGS